MMFKNLKISNSRGSLQKILYKPNSLYIQTTLRFSWHKARAEIELVHRCKDGEIIPVEVKSGSRTRAKSLASYLERYHPSRAVCWPESLLAKRQMSCSIGLYMKRNFSVSCDCLLSACRFPILNQLKLENYAFEATAPTDGSSRALSLRATCRAMIEV